MGKSLYQRLLMTNIFKNNSAPMMSKKKRKEDKGESIILSITAIKQLRLPKQHKICHLIAIVLGQSKNYSLSKKQGYMKVLATQKGTKQSLNDACCYSPTTRSKIRSVVEKRK